MRSKISQREAYRLKKEVAELRLTLNNMRNRYAAEVVGGTHLGRINGRSRDWLAGRIEAARALGHGVVVTSPDCDGSLRFFALPLPKL